MKMEEKDIVNKFRRLHIISSSDEEFKLNANSLLDQLISFAHQSKQHDGENQFLSEQVSR